MNSEYNPWSERELQSNEAGYCIIEILTCKQKLPSWMV